MDSLDRTNVMQATLAKWVLNKQLQSLAILPENASIDDHETLSKDFREREKLRHLSYPLLNCFVSLQFGPTMAI